MCIYTNSVHNDALLFSTFVIAVPFYSMFRLASFDPPPQRLSGDESDGPDAEDAPEVWLVDCGGGDVPRVLVSRIYAPF